MSNINKQALRLTAEKAKDKFMPNFMVPTRDLLALLDELEAADRRNADLEALLEAEVRLWTQRYDCANSRREAAEKSNAFLKGQLAELANFNPDWDKLEASYESWREIAAELLVAKDRVAELEAREVVLPSVQDVHPSGPQSAKIFCEFHRNIVNRCADEIRKVGVNVSIKGE